MCGSCKVSGHFSISSRAATIQVAAKMSRVSYIWKGCKWDLSSIERLPVTNGDIIYAFLEHSSPIVMPAKVSCCAWLVCSVHCCQPWLTSFSKPVTAPVPPPPRLFALPDDARPAGALVGVAGPHPAHGGHHHLLLGRTEKNRVQAGRKRSSRESRVEFVKISFRPGPYPGWSWPRPIGNLINSKKGSI